MEYLGHDVKSLNFLVFSQFIFTVLNHTKLNYTTNCGLVEYLIVYFLFCFVVLELIFPEVYTILLCEVFFALYGLLYICLYL